MNPGRADKRLVRNSCRCKKCGGEIESKHCRDWKQCPCGAIFTDGGIDYVRRGGEPENIEDTSVYIDVHREGAHG